MTELPRPWLGEIGPQNGVVLSSRIRLARNLEGYPFPGGCHPASLSDVIGLIGSRARQLEGFSAMDMYRLHPLEVQLLVERHLISPLFARSNLPRALFLSQDSSLSLMVNEEDHLRLQCLLPGFELEQAWRAASQTESFLSRQLAFAFDNEFGYLTTCPSNVGTGLRASAMLHLPALAWLQALEPVFQQVSQLGLAVRGIYGEGTPASGHMVQISNQMTLGQEEEQIMENIKSICEQLIHYECTARLQLFREQRVALEDRCWRSFGLLRSARILESAEAMEHISMLRLGIDLQLLPQVPLDALNELLIRIRPAGLQMEAGHELSPPERDILRARLVRDFLADSSM